MIDASTLNAYPATTSAETAAARPRFHMRNDPDSRMAGSIPVWENSRSAGNHDPQSASFENALNYADVEPAGGQTADAETDEDSFGFGDLIDIVNPLHHIPLVSAVYEGITGDTIKPAGRIVGGAIFGGLAGAAAGIANVIVEEETGKDMTGNVVAFVTQGELPQNKRETLSPEDHLDQAAQMAFNDIEMTPLPAMALGMQQPATPARAPDNQYERYTFNHQDDDRMAGTMVRRKSAATHNPIPRAPLSDPVSINLATLRNNQISDITTLELSPLPRS